MLCWVQLPTARLQTLGETRIGAVSSTGTTAQRMGDLVGPECNSDKKGIPSRVLGEDKGARNSGLSLGVLPVLRS